MRYQELLTFTEQIKACPLFELEKPDCSRIPVFRPVINVITPTQEYMIISSDPSSDTNKELDETQPHSDFALRFMALMFLGDDGDEQTAQILKHYDVYQDIFGKYFYWTHYSKCYAAGNPNTHCAKRYLQQEIALFEPQLIISIGGKPADLLLGNGKLIDRVNQLLRYGNIPVIACLHPSRDWNFRRREEFSFAQTWDLIRRTVLYSEDDAIRLRLLLEHNEL